MKFNFSRDWLNWASDSEDGCDVGAGAKALGSPQDSSIVRKCSCPNGSQLEQDRLRFYIPFLIGDWGKTVTRAALDGGLVLMLNDDLRVAMLGGHAWPERLRARGVAIEGLDYVLQELQLCGQIRIDNGHMQQRLSLVKPLRESVSPEDQRRLQEMKQIFESQRQLGRVVETEEILDAHLELVSA